MTKQVTLTRTVWVKGKGLPKAGVGIGYPGETVTLTSPNGATWFLQHSYRGKPLSIAVVPSTL